MLRMIGGLHAGKSRGRQRHHQDPKGLEQAASQGCCICRYIMKALEPPHAPSKAYSRGEHNIPTDWIYCNFDDEHTDLHILHISTRTWSLTGPEIKTSFNIIMIENDNHGFDVHELDHEPRQVMHLQHSQIVPTTAGSKVLSLCRRWLTECQRGHGCYTMPETAWYPPRLPDIRTTLPRLLDTSLIQTEGAFAAISHC